MPKVKIDAKVPAFKAASTAGDEFQLADAKGKKLVLYFYPKDNTPHCTTEACGFRDNLFAFRALGAEVVGISLDEVASHRQFARDNRLPFTLLADTTGTAARSYGVLRRVLGIMEVANRETFLVDPAGRIARHYAQVDADRHPAAVLADLKALEARPH